MVNRITSLIQLKFKLLLFVLLDKLLNCVKSWCIYEGEIHDSSLSYIIYITFSIFFKLYKILAGKYELLFIYIDGKSHYVIISSEIYIAIIYPFFEKYCGKRLYIYEDETHARSLNNIKLITVL